MKKTKAAASAIVSRFEKAHDRYLFRGAGNPDHYDTIEKQYKAARQRLVEHLTA